MILSKNIYGVVILYNPDFNVINNIKTYLLSLEQLYVYDNSEVSNFKLIEGLKDFGKEIIYLHNGKNDGISHSLNEICKKLYLNDNAWLLTMDQDSRFDDYSVEDLFDIGDYNSSRVGIISPHHKTVLSKEPDNNKLIERMTVMTSGNLLNVRAHEIIGGFDEKYFIDCVDWEYCLKLNRNNFKVLQNNRVSLSHGLGEPFLVKNFFTGKSKYVLNHSPLRRYYMTRNKLLISKQYLFIYPKRVLRYLASILLEDIINIVLYEGNKIEKMKYVSLAIRDFIFSKFGKYNKN